MARAKRITQEFYCGTCQGYCLIRLNTGLDNIEVDIRCPNPDCHHEHRRRVYKGRIEERGRYGAGAKPKFRICTTKATYSKKPRTKTMEKAQKDGWTGARCDLRRDGVILNEKELV